MHGSATSNSSTIRTNKDWWPNQLNIGILHQYDRRSSPVNAGFSYRDEFKKLDYFALKKDLTDLMTDYRTGGPLTMVIMDHSLYV